ncbi:hypothetical protein ONS95_002726 [Cadophora gregata]|uniref:uncharacterized protein n=1 Tax=Cadophora gregata TaxID=51156 RepID=UPI0026DCB6B1|nr:uncharacterized protein ONS95_002726 [Cadophora gregata]KAK0110069.1 hypothetical protein ONS95_002726 [Cadophora gregata]KAK0110311.1 hypothetical protein ONS96_001929 [Cadophora gregata f. sp. sojae]
MFPLRIKNTNTSAAESYGTVDIELGDRRESTARRSLTPTCDLAEMTSSKPHDKITLLNTLKNILLFRKPGYSPSPAALKDFQDEMERRLKLKSASAGGNGVGRSANCYKVISIHPSSIPEDISFDRMMIGATFPPINMTGFKAFLTNIDYNVENLDFLLYIQHYTKLFEAVADEERAALSPPWTKKDEETAKKAIININRTNHKSSPSISMPQSNLPTPPGSSGDECSVEDLKYEERHSTPPRTADGGRLALMGRSMSDADMDSIAPFAKHASQHLHREESNTEHAEVGPELPISVMNLWKESQRIANAFILPNGPKQLNLSSRERELVLYAIARNNHPTSFSVALRAADHVLRNDSYPKFLQLATPNMNRIRQLFAYSMGYLCIFLGVAYAGVMSMSKAEREWRLFAIPLIVLGVATLYAARRGMCLVLHSLGHYQVKPWEVYDPEHAERAHANPEVFLGGKYKSESRDWVQRYNRRYAMRKIFDKEAPVEEPRIRDAQNVIFGQGLFTGFLASLVVMAVFMSLPPANDF